MASVRALMAIMVVCITLLIVGFAASIITSRQVDSMGIGDHVPVMLGTTRLQVERRAVRGEPLPASDRPVARTRIDLIYQWPDFQPGYPRSSDTLSQRDSFVFIALQPADNTLEPTRRPAELYGHFLTADTWSNPGGLLMRRFDASSPYNDEELYLAAPEGREFSARCAKPDDRSGAETCLWLLRFGDVDVHVRFAPVRLSDWRRLSASLERVLQRSGLIQD
jgi:hypothetical protein